MSIAPQSPRLKQNREVLRIVNRIDRNTRATAKLASAIQYLEWEQRPESELHFALIEVVQERRILRADLYRALGWNRDEHAA